MARFVDLIERNAAEVSARHKDVHGTFERRKDSKAAWQAWEQACRAFHIPHSRVNQLIAECLDGDLCASAETKQFALDYLTVDPIYHRSGYVKEALLARIKRCDLTQRDAERLRQCLIDVTLRGGRREYRRYCRLIPKIGTPELQADLEALLESSDRRVASCARLALGYFPARQLKKGPTGPFS